MPNTLLDFQSLGLSENIIHALKKKGFETPTPIQKQIIPMLLTDSRDIIGQAQTGTGKTAAFGIPLIEKLVPANGATQALILVPTRELAIQVSEEINSLKGQSKLSIFPVYGGQSIDIQLRNLHRGIDIVVWTPGRTLDLIERKALKLDAISYLILDEADEMLNMGFIEDIETIIKNTPEKKQVLLFSATMPDAIKRIAKRYMREQVHFSTPSSQMTKGLTEQIYFEVRQDDKFEALCRIIDTEPDFYSIIFCRTKIDVDTISSKLIERGYSAEGLHGDISQAIRERILKKFRQKTITILVATDVAARGIDVSDLTHVINHSLPQDPESYIHRIGRTGRAGKKGTAITFMTPSEYRQLVYIQRKMNVDIEKKKIPGVSAIISAKKARIHSDLAKILSEKLQQDYLPLADELIGDNDARDIIAAMIQHVYEDELKESNYREIHNSSASVDEKGTARLFVALGRIDGMNSPRDLVTFLSGKSGIPGSMIQGVRIHDKFSFVNVPFHDAEKLLKLLNPQNKRPLITRAREEVRR